MVASGGSMLDVAKELKSRGAKKIFLIATFALFSAGIDKLQKAYDEGLFDQMYSTNLTYVPDEIKKLEWYHDVDCSKLLAKTILEHSEYGKVLETDVKDEQELMKEIINK